MLCVIWYHLYNFKNVKNTHGGVLLLLKVSVLHGCCSRFLNCANGTKLRKASHILKKLICPLVYREARQCFEYPFE